jgi:peptidylprolyl isomerase
MYDGRIMKTPFALFLVSTLPLAAQTAHPSAATVKTPAHAAAHRESAGGGCIKLPELSPKIPALPAGLPCPKALYTISTRPPATLDYVAPIVNAPELRETLRLQEPENITLGYVDIKPGTGAPALPHKWLTVQYDGYLVDGTKFDSSADHPGTPFSFLYGQLGGPGGAIPGWETGFSGMKVGARRRLFIPNELGYGARPQAKIPPRSMLIFDMTLVAVSDTDPNPKPPAPVPHPSTPNAAIKPTVPGAPAGTTAPPATAPAAPAKPATPPASTTTPPSTTPKP